MKYHSLKRSLFCLLLILSSNALPNETSTLHSKFVAWYQELKRGKFVNRPGLIQKVYRLRKTYFVKLTSGYDPLKTPMPLISYLQISKYYLQYSSTSGKQSYPEAVEKMKIISMYASAEFSRVARDFFTRHAVRLSKTRQEFLVRKKGFERLQTGVVQMLLARLIDIRNPKYKNSNALRAINEMEIYLPRILPNLDSGYRYRVLGYLHGVQWSVNDKQIKQQIKRLTVITKRYLRAR